MTRTVDGSPAGSIEKMVADAFDKMKRIVVPAPNEVFLDIDNEDDERHARRILADEAWQIAFRSVGREIQNIEWEASSSGKPNHWHVALVFNDALEPAARIAIQASLGSDRKHELLSIIALLGGNPIPTVLFKEPAYAKGTALPLPKEDDRG